MSAVEFLSSSAAPAGAIPGGEELIQRARALAPKLRERALRAERDRNIPREFGRGIHRCRPDPHHHAEALGRL